MKRYTFRGHITTMTFSQSGAITVYGKNEAEARENAIKEICKVHRIHRDCVRIEKLIGIN